ncbi:MAG TPA: outer membrane beta-barrel protein [Puia sp.]|nr:outer membrane beta-barrel protein [Puia sp.]
MKKLLICILCLASVQGFSQLRLGVQGSFSSLNFWQNDGYTGLDAGENTWAMNGWQAGVFAEYDLGYSGLEIQPALMYATTGAHLGQSKGFADAGTFVIGFSDTKLKINTIRLPVNLLYSFRIDTKWKVFGGLGPYIAKNLSGTEKGYYTGYDNSSNNYVPGTYPINNNIHLSSDQSFNAQGKSNVASLDAGMDILLGFQYKKLQVSASWTRGFSREYYTSYVNMGNVDWNFTLGYILFGHERKPRL